ncbi:hypothetical protein EDB19DRAFT_1902026 [Suillus lakei]|nr:hypothetical protein EDB19DRAFT_1902026 [Suillus lakei]
MDARDRLDTGLVRRDESGNLLDGKDPANTITQTANSALEAFSNPFSGITSASGLASALSGISSVINDKPSASESTSTASQESISSSTTTPSASTPSTTSTSVSTSSSTPTPTPTSTPTSTPTPVPSASVIVLASTSGTSIIYVTSTASSLASATAAAPQSFLQNKPLEGGVFALIGIVIMVMIFVVVTYAIRRRQRNRLESDIAGAITFDPAVNKHYGDEEKGTNSFDKYRLSRSSSGHGYGFVYGPRLAYAPPPVPQYGHYGLQEYEQQPPTYHVPPTQGPVYNLDSPVNMGGAGDAGGAVDTGGAANTGGAVDTGSAVNKAAAVSTGGANLTRKYSDRKPVPPLLPNPVYDPSQSPVLPSHYYMQNQDAPISPISQSMSPSVPPGDLTTPALSDDLEEDPYTGMLKAC